MNKAKQTLVVVVQPQPPKRCILVLIMTLWIASCLSFVEALNYNATLLRDRILIAGLKDYKHHERPKVREIGEHGVIGDATKVYVNMKILAITSVNVIDMEFTVDMLLRQRWLDPRLAWQHNEEFRNFTYEISVPSLREKLWLPDLFFRNGKHGYVHTMTMPNHLLRIMPNGTILYSQKITMRFSCPMKLSNFPMDTQHCSINIGSYAYTLDELKFVWNMQAAVELPKELQISEFNPPSHVHTEDCSKSYSTITGNYTCLLATFRMQRQLGSYLAGTYVPAVLIVMVSWLSFWVSVEAVPARVTLGLLTLLGILTQGNTVMANLPRVSYIKAVDVWMSSCIIFVVGALIEFVLASMNLRKQSDNSWQEDIRLVVRMELARHGLCKQHWQKSKNNYFKRRRCASESDQQNNNVIFLQDESPQKSSQGDTEMVTLRSKDPEYSVPPSNEQTSNTFLSMPRPHTIIQPKTRTRSTKSTPIRWKTHDGTIHYPRASKTHTVTFSASTREQATQQIARETVAIYRQVDYATTPSNETTGSRGVKCNSTSFLSSALRETDILSSREDISRGKPSEMDMAVENIDSSSLLTTQTASIELSQTLLSGPKSIPKPAGVVCDSEMDAYSRFLFPACFMLYNCFYWFYYLVLNRS